VVVVVVVRNNNLVVNVNNLVVVNVNNPVVQCAAYHGPRYACGHVAVTYQPLAPLDLAAAAVVKEKPFLEC
jgi:hypothetical protein